LKPIKFVRKGVRILVDRVRTQGLKTTLVWIYGRGVPKLTGVPLLGFSRITEQIYVGPQYGQRGKAHLLKSGIENDVNMRIEFDDAEHNLALPNYCHLPTIDDDAPTIAHLEQGVVFIRECVREGGKVYIHCAGGIGRAPTMAAAYFISEGQSLDSTIALIKQSRPFINITAVQMERLRAFEQLQRVN